MEKSRVIQLNSESDYSIIEENRRILESGKRETGTERALIHNPSVTNEVVKSQQNIWTSRVLRNRSPQPTVVRQAARLPESSLIAREIVGFNFFLISLNVFAEPVVLTPD